MDPSDHHTQHPQHTVGPVKRRRPAQRLSQAPVITPVITGRLFSLIVAAADFHPGKVQMFKFIAFPSVRQEVPPRDQPDKDNQQVEVHRHTRVRELIWLPSVDLQRPEL